MTDSSKELIVPIDLNPETAVALFTEESEFDNLLKRITEQTDSHEPDTSTAKGRDEIKSLAYKVTRTKTTLDDLGKAVKEDAQKTVDAVDASRKRMRDTLDDLKTKVRKPLTDYEAAEKEKDDAVNADLNKLAELKTVPFNATPASIQEMQEQVATISGRNDWRGKEEKADTLIEACRSIHSQALSAAQERERMEAENARLQKEREEAEARERERAEKERAEAEERERQEAARKAAEEAQAAEMEQLRREKAEAEEKARQAEESAQREREEADRAAKAREQEERERQERERLAAEKAEADRIEAERQEKLRAEREAAEREAAEKREAERKAKEAEEREGRMINAGNDLREVCGLDDDTAGKVVKAIADGQIENLSFC